MAGEDEVDNVGAGWRRAELDPPPQTGEDKSHVGLVSFVRGRRFRVDFASAQTVHPVWCSDCPGAAANYVAVVSNENANGAAPV